MRCIDKLPFISILMLFSFISCDNDNTSYTDCMLKEIKLEKPGINYIFEKEFTFNENGNLISENGYPNSQGGFSDDREQILYVYNNNNYLIEIYGSFVGQYTNNTRKKTFIYNSNNELVERIDSTYYLTSGAGIEYGVSQFLFNHKNNEVSGSKYDWIKTWNIDGEYVYIPYDTTYFSLTKVNEHKLIHKVYNSDSVLINEESIEYLLDDRRNPYFSSNLNFDELYYFFEQSYINRYDNYKIPYFGPHNFISLSIDLREIENKYVYKYSMFDYPKRLEVNGYIYEYIYKYW